MVTAFFTCSALYQRDYAFIDDAQRLACSRSLAMAKADDDEHDDRAPLLHLAISRFGNLPSRSLRAQ